MTSEPLLPSNALAGVRLAISVSESPDLARLGLTETHFRLALGEIARRVLTAGGTLAYGGHLEPTGYTTFLANELQRYGKRKNRPLLICLAWQEHRRLKLSELDASRKALGLYGEIVCLNPAGNVIDPKAGRGEDPVPVDDAQEKKEALTAMRHYMRSRIQGRVILGGRRHGFQGNFPGLMEEVMVAFEEPGAPQPLYLASGFGGVTADIVRALGIDDLAWLPRPSDASPDDPRLVDGCTRLQGLRQAPGWTGLSNGLSDQENRYLAATYRPSEIADFVILGLGRKFAKPI